MNYFLGCDVALNHSGFLALDEDGKVVGLRYLTDQKSSADRSRRESVHFAAPNPKQVPDSRAREMLRLANAFTVYRRFIAELAPSFAYVEGYAYGTPKGELTGEVAGAVKLTLWGRGVPFRLMGPESVKMFAAWKGDAEKAEVIQAVRARWSQDFTAYRKQGDAADAGQTEEDLADAYVLARMCWTEWRLRSGRTTPQDLEHDQERRVYLRATKVQPVNILGSEWTALAAVPEKFRP